MTKSMKIPTNNLALALGGGAARGAFHLGVLDFCEQHNIVFVNGDDLKSGKVTSCGCVQKENLNRLLEDMGNQHVEMKSYLLEVWNVQNKEAEFFGGLSL